MNQGSKKCLPGIAMQRLPNCITGLRMAGSLLLAVFSPSAVPFWVIYLFCGVTDWLDGWLARRLHAESRIGAALFLLPLFLWSGSFQALCALVGAVALAAAMEELWIQLTSKTYNADVRRIWQHK